MPTYLFPRLTRADADRLFEEIGERSIEELRAESSLSSDYDFYAQTGGTRVSEESLRRIQSNIRALARRYGYPSLDGGNRAEFDAKCSTWLLNETGIAPGEALRDEVWAFVALVMLPDVAAWRFKGRNRRRFIGGVRNTFQRLWKRAFLLSDDNDPPTLLLRLQTLGEDTYLQLIERPGVSSNPRVATHIADSWMRNREKCSSTIMDRAHEKVMIELVQMGAMICIDTLPTEKLSDLLDNLYDTHISLLNGPKSSAPTAA